MRGMAVDWILVRFLTPVQVKIGDINLEMRDTTYKSGHFFMEQ